MDTSTPGAGAAAQPPVAPPKPSGSLAGHKRARPAESDGSAAGPQTVAPGVPAAPGSASGALPGGGVPAAPSSSSQQSLIAGSAASSTSARTPLTINQQRSFAIEHRKASVSQIKAHLASAKAEYEHLQKGRHYVNFRAPTVPQLAVAAPQPRSSRRSRASAPPNGAPKPATAATLSAAPPAPAPASASASAADGAASIANAVIAQQNALGKQLEELRQRKRALVSQLQELRRTSGRRMRRSSEPPRNKVHWDYLLEEMAWMAKDYKAERRWKNRLAKKIMRAVVSYHGRQKKQPERQAKLELIRRKRGAAAVARLVKKFWSNIAKLAQFKITETIKQKQTVDLDRHLELLVDRTQTLTKMVAKDLVVGVPADDAEFELRQETVREREDAEAFAEMEAEEKTSKEDHAKEVSALQAESTMSLDELKAKYSYQKMQEAETKTKAEAQAKAEAEAKAKGEAGAAQAGAAQGESGGGGAGGEAGQGSQGDSAPMEQDEDEESSESEDERQIMLNASELAAGYQPSGFDLGSVKVKTPLPALLRHGTLREYQHIGLDWLVTMCDNQLNGILADEMGLGKTIQTIALLAHLASARGIWGQHLVVVPTSVLVNWEMEFKRWLPGFKILCYHGSAKERKRKRRGWNDPNKFHVLITSYQLILQDSHVFKRKRWHYLILDEAQNIKNFKSKRWQVLLTFRTERRLLLTGTPLQNNVMELWSLMHFLMPDVFQSQKEFQDWFSDPVRNMVEGKAALNHKKSKEILDSLHKVLRPFILRRLKKDVAKQMPKKYEHVVHCRLSKRQRILYEEFMANSATRNTLARGNFLGLMNVLMQLRKVCNHPDIFAGRPIVSPFQMSQGIELSVPTCVSTALEARGWADCVSSVPSLSSPSRMDRSAAQQVARLCTPESDFESMAPPDVTGETPSFSNGLLQPAPDADGQFMAHWTEANRVRAAQRAERVQRHGRVNALRCDEGRLGRTYSQRLIDLVTIVPRDQARTGSRGGGWADTPPSALRAMVKSSAERAADCADMVSRFVCLIPKARAPAIRLARLRPTAARRAQASFRKFKALADPSLAIFRPAMARQTMSFPDRRLIQWDCGKLQQLAQLLKQLKTGGHRVLIFTQMTKMLNILEQFLNIYGWTYLRLDGTTKPEQRQRLMEKFNNNDKIFCFILSTRSGGVGVNLTGADTVVFYDTDWNPAMDLQAQDRCHRIGQTREVHIYRLITKNTVEENILKKSNQKREMNTMVIGDGEFNTQFFSRMDPRELLGMAAASDSEDAKSSSEAKGEAPATQPTRQEIERAMACAEDAVDRTAARQLMKETQSQRREFVAPVADASAKGAAARKPLTSSSFESSLSKVQRYALRFVEVTDPSRNPGYSFPILNKSAKASSGASGSVAPTTAAGSPPPGDAATTERTLVYPASSKSVTCFQARVAELENRGYIYENRVFIPPLFNPFPQLPPLMEKATNVVEAAPEEEPWGLFCTDEQVRKMLPSSRDRNKGGPERLFLHNSARGQRDKDTDAAPLTLRIPYGALRGLKRRALRPVPSRHRRKAPRQSALGFVGARADGARPPPRKAYTQVAHDKRVYTKMLFPPKVGPVVRSQPMRSRSSKIPPTAGSEHIPWTRDEEVLVERAVARHGPNWSLVAHVVNKNQRVGGRFRTPAACRFHYMQIMARGTISDEKLRKEGVVRMKKLWEAPKSRKRDQKDVKRAMARASSIKIESSMLDTPLQNTENAYPMVAKLMQNIHKNKLAQRQTGEEGKIKTDASHQKAITHAHKQMGLPQQAIGKTLMPHQIIQLRDRARDGAGGGASMRSKSMGSSSKRKQHAAAAHQRRLAVTKKLQQQKDTAAAAKQKALQAARARQAAQMSAAQKQQQQQQQQQQLQRSAATAAKYQEIQRRRLQLQQKQQQQQKLHQQQQKLQQQQQQMQKQQQTQQKQKQKLQQQKLQKSQAKKPIRAANAAAAVTASVPTPSVASRVAAQNISKLASYTPAQKAQLQRATLAAQNAQRAALASRQQQQAAVGAVRTAAASRATGNVVSLAQQVSPAAGVVAAADRKTTTPTAAAASAAAISATRKTHGSVARLAPGQAAQQMQQQLLRMQQQQAALRPAVSSAVSIPPQQLVQMQRNNLMNLMQGNAQSASLLTAQRVSPANTAQNPHQLAKFVRYVLQAAPSLRQRIIQALAVKTWTESQKLDWIVRLFKQQQQQQQQRQQQQEVSSIQTAIAQQQLQQQQLLQQQQQQQQQQQAQSKKN